MSYFAICSFDLKGGNSEDYQMAYADLRKIGFSTTVPSGQGKEILLPTTTTAGVFDGGSAGSVRDDLLERVRKAFASRGFSSEIFIFVGGDWAWGRQTT